MGILIDVAFLDEPMMGADARDLVELLNKESVVHITEVMLERDYIDLDGEVVGISLKPRDVAKDESPAIVYTREPFDSAKVLEEVKKLLN